MDTLNQQLAVRVDVHSIQFSGLSSFPNLGLRFNRVRIAESTPMYHQSLLTAGELVVEVNLLKLFKGQNEVERIELRGGSGRFYNTLDGKTNYDILKPDSSASTSSLSLSLNKVKLINFRCIYKDDASNQSLNFLAEELQLSGRFEQDQFKLKAKGNALFDHLVMEGKKLISGRNCAVDMDMEINRKVGSCHFSKANLFMDQLQVSLEGDLLMVGETPDLDLKFTGSNMDIQSLISLLPNKQGLALKSLQSTGQISLSGYVKGRLEGETLPEMRVTFALRDVGIFDPEIGLDIRHVLLNGLIQNRAGQQRLQLVVNLTDLKTERSQLSGKINVADLSTPDVRYNLKGHIDLRDVAGMIEAASGSTEPLYGNISMNLTGNVLLNNNGVPDYTKSKVLGDIEVSDLSLHAKEIPRLANIYLKATLREQQGKISEFKGIVEGSHILFKGDIDQWQGYLFGDERLMISGELAGQNLDLNKMFSLSTEATEASDPMEAKRLNTGIDLDLLVNATDFAWDKLQAKSISGRLIWEVGDMYFQEVSMQAWDGKVEGNASLITLPDGFSFKTKARVSDISIEKLLTEFDNFDQTEFTSEILQGELSSLLLLNMKFDRYFNVVEDSVQMLADVIIEKGRLKNYKPMESLSTFVQLSDLQDIRFEQLKNTLEIKNRTITIPYMTIKNSAMNMELEGSQTFDNLMDYRIKIRVTELLAGKSGWVRRKKEQQLQEESEGGLSAFIRLTGTPDDLKIRYDVKSVREVLKESVKAEKKSFLQDVKKALRGEQIETRPSRKDRWLE